MVRSEGSAKCTHVILGVAGMMILITMLVLMLLAKLVRGGILSRMLHMFHVLHIGQDKTKSLML